MIETKRSFRVKLNYADTEREEKQRFDFLGYTTFPRGHFRADISANDIFAHEYTPHDATAL